VRRTSAGSNGTLQRESGDTAQTGAPEAGV
jgi:hypothetical protein